MKPAPFDFASLPPALRSAAEVVTEAPKSKALARANTFEEGQLSGPFGPQFSHYGEMPFIKASLGATLAFAGFVAISAGLIMALR